MSKLSFNDILTLVALPIIGMLVSIWANPPYFVSILLFYAAPGIYLTVCRGQRWQALKSLLFAVVMSVPFTMVVDFIGTANNVWYVPKSVFPVRVLRVIPLEDFLWMIAGTYTIVALYAVTIDKGKRELADKKLRYFVAPALCALVIFVALVIGAPTPWPMESHFTYLWLGTAFFAVPAGLFLWYWPRFLRRLPALITYFFYVTILFELTATLLRQWVFPGNYLFQPLVLGGAGPIPYEELLFVGFVGPVAAVAFYEWFDDDLI